MSDDLELGRARAGLDALAAAVETPDDDDLRRMARAASSTAREPGRRRPLPAAVAAVAASAAVAVLAVSGLGSDSGSAGGGTGTTSLVSFPEGSALRLLTSNTQGEPR
jgi:ferric-dicitrate binding protein FerR (iron transport regulator)